MVMKYIVSESQYNRLLSEDENEMTKYLRRRLPEIKEIINSQMEENDPNDFGDEFEYASNIISWTIQDLEDFDFDNMDEDELNDIIKEYFGEMILDHYYDNVNPDDDDDDF